MKNYTDRMRFSLRALVLGPLAAVFVVTAAWYVWNLYGVLEEEFRQETRDLLAAGRRLLAEHQADMGHMLGATAQVIAQDRGVRAALKARDAEALLREGLPRFEQLRIEHGITHLYFSDANRENLVRVHRRMESGGRVDRTTMLAAQNTGQLSVGLEVGQLGTLTLRAVQPVLEGDVRLGFVETGIEIDTVADRLAETLGAQVMVRMDKSLVVVLERWRRLMEDWVGREVHWDADSGWALLGKRGASLPAGVAARLRDGYAREQTYVTETADGRTLGWGVIPVLDVDGRLVAELVVFKDMSERSHEVWQAIYRAGGLQALLMGALLVLFYLLLGRTQRYIAASTRRLAESEERLRKLNETLEARVHSRTAELEAANRELETFSYSASHDLRAPLRAIDGFSQILVEEYGERLDETGRGYLARVRAGAQRMGDLIDDLLELARVSRAAMNVETLDLSALSREILAELQSAEPGRRVTATVAEGLTAAGDPQMLRLLLQNLLENAWKYTGKRTDGEIEVGRTATAEGRPAFYVRDNGVGFDMADARKLFSAFTRLHAVDDFPGTGIGLATVARIAKRHGGAAWAQAQAGKGATFYFALG